MSDPGTPDDRTPWTRRGRVTVQLAVIVVVFLAGISVGVLALSVWVTPTVKLVGVAADQYELTAPCNGWPQISFDGFFQCTVTLACNPSVTGTASIPAVTSPSVANLIVSPSTPRTFSCGTTVTLHISGQLGYSGTAEVDLGA